MLTTKVQTSLRIQCLCYSLTNMNNSEPYYVQTFNILAGLCSCEDWLKPNLIRNPKGLGLIRPKKKVSVFRVTGLKIF